MENENVAPFVLVPDKEEKSLRKTFDDILVEVGEFGRYQRWVYFYLFLPTIFSAMQKMAWVFLGAKADHRCRLPGEQLEPYPELWPEDNAAGLIDGESCYYMSENGNRTYCDQGWIYDRSTFGSSAVMDWSLVCADGYLRATAQAIFMLGVMIGSITFGALSDRYGRKPVFLCSVALQFAFGMTSAFAPEFWSFVAARFFVGMTTSGVFLVSYVLAMEMVGPRHRVLAGTLCQYYYTFGFFLMAALAYLLNADWKMLQVALTAPTLLFVSYWWLMPESVRWLIRKGENEKAKIQINKVAHYNKVELEDETIESVFATAKEDQEKETAKVNFFGLFRSKRMTFRTINIFFNWFVNSGAYYGLSLNSVDLGGNPYFNFMMSAAVEIPAYLINLFLLNRPSIGRRPALAGCLFTAGVALLLTLFVPETQLWLLLSLSMLGKLAITCSYGIVYIFSAEVFPTDVRSAGMGGASMCARVGGILCPYLNLIGAVWAPLPLLVYGGLALLAGSASLLLPESKNKKLPETMDEAEAMC